MNTYVRLCIISCACFCAAHALAAVTVIEKELKVNIGNKSNKPCTVKAFSFMQGAETKANIWLSVFPLEENLVFYIKFAQPDPSFPVDELAFPVAEVIRATEPTTVELDFANKTSPIKILENNQKPTSLLTMKLSFSQEFQIFRELMILLAKADKKALQSFANKHSLEKINEISFLAILNQCQFITLPDDEKKFSQIQEGKIKITKPTQLTGKFGFIPAHIILEALKAEAAQLEAQQTAGQA